GHPGRHPRRRALPGLHPAGPRRRPGPERHEADLSHPGRHRAGAAAMEGLQPLRQAHAHHHLGRREAEGDGVAAMLEINNLSKTFFAGTVNERKALRNINLQLTDGEFVTVIGSNGAGKSTVLNMIGGKLRPDAGTVRIAGKDVTKLADHSRARYIGRVFQDPMAGTAPSMTIEENMSLALNRGKRRGLGLGVTKGKREQFAHELESLELGLEKRLKAKVGLLSGGQRQALSLLMATFSGPKILLLDEHTAALDPQRAALVARLTEEIVQRHRLTTLMVTHNMEQALRLGTRLVMMHDGEIILDLDAEAKSRMTVPGLLKEFEKIKGAQLDDRTMLQ